MPEYTYEIVMEASLGKRLGSLMLDSLCGGCRGLLSLMTFDNPVFGTVYADGTCCLSGWMRTLIQNLPFTAEGKISGEGLELTMHWNGKCYPIHGHLKGV